jgi:hypothetical protein
VLAVAAVVVAGAGFVTGRAVGGSEAGDEVAERPRPSRDEVLDTLEEGIYENMGGSFTLDEASCIADGIVDSIGTDRMIDLGIHSDNPYGGFTMADLTDAEQREYLMAHQDCLSDARLPEFWSGWLARGLEADQAACIGEGIVTELGAAASRELWVDAMLSPNPDIPSLVPPENTRAVQDLFVDC